MNPLIRLENDGQVATLSYNVPEPSIYHGQIANVISVSADVFKPATVEPVSMTVSLDRIRAAMSSGFADPSIFPNLGVPPNYLAYVDGNSPKWHYFREWIVSGDTSGPRWDLTRPHVGVIAVGADAPDQFGNPGPVIGNDKHITKELALLTPEKVQQQLSLNKRLFITKTPTGQYNLEWIDNAPPFQGLALLERYQLSTYLGNYGAGRTLQTFSLLPGERCKFSIKSYIRQSVERKDNSSILDTHSNQSSNEFSDSVGKEHSNKQDRQKKTQWYVGVEAQADWGVASVKASANYNGGMNSGREQFAKELSNAVSKHATKASSKRDIKVQQAREVKTEEGTEQGILREVQNVNVGRTLNFVFRQMNQEYISILHLIDVELGYSSGLPGGVRRYPLSSIEQLLSDCVKDEHRDAVRQRILSELRCIIDYQGNAHELIEQVSIPVRPEDGQPATYWRVKPALRSQYTSDSGHSISGIQGIILDATETVMRTDGVMVEALLGQGEGLDPYSQNLQNAAWKAKEEQARYQTALAARTQLAKSLAQTGDPAAAQLFATVYPNQSPLPVPGGSAGK